MDDNIPYGFEDPGLKTIRQSKANSTDLKQKQFEERFKGFPQTPQEAEAALYKISLMEKSIDHDSIL